MQAGLVSSEKKTVDGGLKAELFLRGVNPLVISLSKQGLDRGSMYVGPLL